MKTYEQIQQKGLELAAEKFELRGLLRETLNRIEQTLTVPAAEYVPAIGDVFRIIDEARKQLRGEQP